MKLTLALLALATLLNSAETVTIAELGQADFDALHSAQDAIEKAQAKMKEAQSELASADSAFVDVYHGIEPIIYLLMCGIVFFAVVLLVNVLSAFVGAFLARVKPPEAK